MRILVLANFDLGLYNFRKELLKKLLDMGNEVYISLPCGEKIKSLCEMGCKFIETKINRHGTSIKEDLSLLKKYRGIMRSISPEVVLTYTIKPNLYGGMAAASLSIPHIANVTGLGTAIEKKSVVQTIIKQLYKAALKKTSCVFFQNSRNLDFFEKNRIKLKKYRLIPGSGVNTSEFKVTEYPENDITEFALIARVMKDKGVDEYLSVAEYIRTKHPDTRFHIFGELEDEYGDILKKKQEKGIIIYHGSVDNIKEVLEKIHCIIHPSYHEGMSNVLLEALASGRPCLCSDIPGCKEIVDDGISGFLFAPKNEASLKEAIEKFLVLSFDEKKQMGLNARRKVEKEFDRNIVIGAYIEEIQKVMEAKNERLV